MSYCKRKQLAEEEKDYLKQEVKEKGQRKIPEHLAKTEGV